jgi:hypothetical protein
MDQAIPLLAAFGLGSIVSPKADQDLKAAMRADLGIAW